MAALANQHTNSEELKLIQITLFGGIFCSKHLNSGNSAEESLYILSISTKLEINEFIYFQR